MLRCCTGDWFRGHLSWRLVGGSRTSRSTTDGYFIASHYIEKILSLATTHWIICTSVVLDIKKALHPLHKLEVVLVFGLNELVNINIALDIVLQECLLQNLVVLDIFVVVLCVPLNFIHRNSARVARINDLAIQCSCGALLNLGQLKLEEIIGPREQLSTPHEEGSIHHANCVSVCHFFKLPKFAIYYYFQSVNFEFKLIISLI